MMAGPIAHYHTNSRYYSAVRPRVPQSLVDRQLPHVTIQMPVFKESLVAVLCVSYFPFQHFTNMSAIYSEPSIRSLKKAMQTYARQGGTSSLFVCDDGLRVLPPAVRARVSVEAGVPMGWRDFVGDAGRIVGLNHYGASAAYSTFYEEFGLTTEAVVAAARESLRAAGTDDVPPAGPGVSTGGLDHPTGDR